MCGIAGIIDLREQREINRALLREMTDSMTHRGPDESGLHIEPGVGLGHRRLSIIDLASGQQPMHNQADDVILTYNGEIYNFQALRDELEQAGYTFSTHSDTEALLHAWEHWGEDCVAHLRGMFAFAVWDRRRQTLFLARDRIGIKPLYYAVLDHGQVIFASELKGILKHPEFKRELDPKAVDEYFAFGYVPEPRSIFRQARKLPPGHSLALRHGQPAGEPSEYWDIRFQPSARGDEHELGEELTHRIREAVDMRMVAEVPLGAFLSGGVDSSAVVAMMAGLQQEPVNTCSIAFDVKQFDESDYAARVAGQYHTAHQVQRVDTGDYSLIGKLAGLYDEPYADSSALPTYRVCELARQNVTVALSGDGGDENLAGYRRYKLHMMEEGVRSRIPYGLRRPVFGFLGRVYPKADWAPRVFRGKTTFQSLARDSVAAYFHTVSIFNDILRPQLYSDTFKRELQGYGALEVFRRHAARAGTDDPLSLVQYLDIKTYLVGDILTKVDRASMAHALEVRVPLLDHELMEWIAGLPSGLKLKSGEGKYIFKKAMEPYLPSDILYRPKMGFAVPLASWFRGPLKEHIRETILGPRLRETGFFNQAFLQHMVDAHQSGRRDYSALLWTTMMFDAFLERQMI